MDFKFKSTVFKNTVEDQKRLYKDKYDPNKPYPELTGTLSIPSAQLPLFIAYLHWALRTELKTDSYLNDVVVPIRISGWQKESKKGGKKFLSLEYSPDYKTLVAAREAKDAAANLAKGTAGTVVQTQQDDVF